MNLNCETVLSFYTLKNKRVLCQIRTHPKCSRLKKSCRYLSEEQWSTFDKELAKYLSAKDCWNNARRFKFNINPSIAVKVQKSKLSLKHFYICLGSTGDLNKDAITDVIESNIILECVIEFHPEIPLSTSILPPEYEPQIENSSVEKLGKPLPYEPYTPSKKHLKAANKDSLKKDGIDILENNEDTYTPKPIFEIDAIEPILNQVIPKYVPAPINTRQSAKEKHKLRHSIRHNEVEYKMDTKNISSDKYKLLGKKLNKTATKVECEYIPRSKELSIDQVPIYIPTPIEETITEKIFKADNVKTNRKRSNTIDVFPGPHEEIAKEKETPLGDIENHIQYYNKKLKQRSMTIDEIPAVLADVPVYTPTPIENPKLQTVLNSELLNENMEENYLPKEVQIDNSVKHEECKTRKLYGRSLGRNEISNVFVDSKDKRNFDKLMEKEKSTTQIALVSDSSKTPKTQTIIDDKPLHQWLGNLAPNSKFSEKDINTEKKVEKSSHGIHKSMRRSKRSPSKPKRLIEESDIIKTGFKRLKPSPKNKELFGTDDDDDDDDSFRNSNNENTKTLDISLDRKPNECKSKSLPTRKEHKRHKSKERARGEDNIIK